MMRDLGYIAHVTWIQNLETIQDSQIRGIGKAIFKASIPLLFG